MNLRRLIVLGLPLFCALILTWVLRPVLSQKIVAKRSFDFVYLTRIPTPPAGSRILRIWVPLPQSDSHQAIQEMKIESPFPYTKHREREYDNEYLYLQIPATKISTPTEVAIRFHATRLEHRLHPDVRPVRGFPSSDTSATLRRYLQPDRLVPLDGIVGELSKQETRGIQNPLAKARAIYDYVVATLRYDKSGVGWGNGDALWACTAKHGNCTDFHSLFIGMMRSAGIPARFEIGFPLPEDQHEGAIPGYHCWAEFYLEPYGWIPVDASEAWRHPEKRDYFFGAHDPHRVQFTLGRDLHLNPPQQGEPLNYFVYPYAELDGKQFAVESKFSFQDTVSRTNN